MTAVIHLNGVWGLELLTNCVLHMQQKIVGAVDSRQNYAERNATQDRAISQSLALVR